MYGQGFVDQRDKREGLVLYQSLWIINELKLKVIDKILTDTKFIEFTSQNVFKSNLKLTVKYKFLSLATKKILFSQILHIEFP